MKYLKRNCPCCASGSIGLGELSKGVGGRVIFCLDCKQRFELSSGSKWFLSFIGTLFIPIFVLLFSWVGFVWSAFLSISIQVLIYYFVMLNLPLKERKLQAKSG